MFSITVFNVMMHVMKLRIFRYSSYRGRTKKYYSFLGLGFDIVGFLGVQKCDLIFPPFPLFMVEYFISCMV